MRAFDTDRGIRAAFTILRHRHQATLLAAAAVALISIAFLGTSQVLAQTAGDRAFLAWAVQIEIQQQDMGRIAERRAQTAAVREFGGYLVQRHQQAQQRLETVASRLGAAPSSKLSATHLRVQSHFRSIPPGSFDGPSSATKSATIATSSSISKRRRVRTGRLFGSTPRAKL